VLPDVETESDEDNGTSHDSSAVLPKHSIMAHKSAVNEQQLASFGNKG